MYPIQLVLPLLILSLSFSALAEDQLGELKINDVSLKAKAQFVEPQQGEFNILESGVGFQWKLNPSISTQFRIGSRRLIGQPHWHLDELSDQLGFYEAYGQLQTVYGRFRFGLIPLDYGVEGTLQESETFFPRSLLFSNRVVALRDMGLSYFIAHNGFYTQFAASNGEGESNPDGRMFLTSKWGWSNWENLNLGVMGQTGTLKPESATNSTSTLAGLDLSKESKLRMGGLFAHWYPNRWNLLLEVSLLEAEEKEDNIKKSQLISGHFDIVYTVNSLFQFQIRYDHFEPDNKVDGDLQREYTVGIALHSQYLNSIFYVLGTKVVEEDEDVANDRLLFVWQLTPKIRKFQ